MKTHDPLLLANAVTKALYPDLYGQPDLSTEQVAMLMGCRGIVHQTLAAELVNGPETLTIKVDAASLSSRLSGTKGVVLDLFAERDRQDAQWGGPDHDDTHTGSDWLIYIEHQRATAYQETLSDDGDSIVDPEGYRQRMVKIAALAFAAIESLDRSHPRPAPGGEVEPDEEQPRTFGKQELLDYLDAALPGDLGIREFSMRYWAQIGMDRDGEEALQRALAVTKEYQSLMAHAGRIEVGMDFADSSISLSVSA